MNETATDPKAPNPARQLVLHTMLSLLVSVVVFVVLSYLVIVPQLARQAVRIRTLEAEIAEMQEEAEEAAEAPPAAAAPAPAPQPSPAPAPPAAAAK